MPNWDQNYLVIVAAVLFIVFAVELVIIYRAVSNDLKKFSQKSTLFIQGKIHMLTGKPVTAQLEYKKQDPLAKHFQFKDIHTLDMIFDLPESHIRDIEFTEDDSASSPAANAKTKFFNLLTLQQKTKITYYGFSYAGYSEFLVLVEKKLKWKSGVKRKVLVLTELETEKKITFSHYLAFEKSRLLDVVDSEIFWGVDICAAVVHTEQLPPVKKEKINELFSKYDDIWIFEPVQAKGSISKVLGLQDDTDVKAETEAYDQ